MSNISPDYTENNTASPRVIVSLTTYPARIDRVHIAIESLLHQTRPADMIVLWLAVEQFPEGEASLPEQLLALKSCGLIIEWCKDIRSYKKLLPAVQKWPNDIIITADDDIIYRIDTIECLLECHARHPECVSTMRAHLMQFTPSRELLPYNDWKLEYSGIIDKPKMALFPTTGAGTLFPPGVLPEETFNVQKALELCPRADDVWVKFMLALVNVPVVLACENTRLLLTEGSQSESLYSYNLTENDTQIAAVLNAYNAVGGEDNDQDTLLCRMNDLSDYTPDDSLCQKYRTERSYANEKTGVRVSVIIAAHNAKSTIRRCLMSAAGQTVSDIEIICVDIASTDGTADIIRELMADDRRIKLISLDEECDAAAARKIAVLDSRGEYCIFPEEEGILAPDACEQLYTRAEQGDADILTFTSGRISGGKTEPEKSFIGYAGRLRNTKILPRLTEEGKLSHRDLHSSIFGGRLCRKAYVQCEGIGESLFEYFLLVRNAEVYVGEDTPVYYASPDNAKTAAAAAESLKAIGSYAEFTGIEELQSICRAISMNIADSEVERCISADSHSRMSLMDEMIRNLGAAEVSEAISKAAERHGPRVLRLLKGQPALSSQRRIIENVGVAVLDNRKANSLFTMTEALDCVAVNHSTTLIGVSRAAASAAVFSARTTFAGEMLLDDSSADPHVFAHRLDSVIDDNALDAIIVSPHSRHFARAVLLAKLRGLAVVVLMSEPPYASMTDCSLPAACAAALELADVTVTASEEQAKLLRAMGLNAAVIPPPPIRLMGGRSSGRASANTVVWTGDVRDIQEACGIFEIIRRSVPDARMQMYVDGVEGLDEIAAEQPEGVSLRRLRPDYGIFADAAVHIMTCQTGTAPASLRAAATLGVPTVMYRLTGDNNDYAGAIAVESYDRASAARNVILLLEDRAKREELSAKARAAAGSNSRQETVRLWDDVLDSMTAGAHVAENELSTQINAMMVCYEDGAHYNAGRLAEYSARCEDYEQRLVQAEERRVRETDALRQKIDEAEKALRQKDNSLKRVKKELDDVRGSTIFKVGSILTAIPRSIKTLVLKLIESKHRQ